jgi:TP901 family phage tail tape measure protein
MQLSKLDKLMFTIGMIDAVSKPMGKIMGKLQQLQDISKSAMTDIAVGAAGVAAAVMLVTSSLGPAIDQNRALGEVASLGVAQEDLALLNKTSLEFSSNFGDNSQDVVRAAYDIQSAIAGLTGEELAAFTNASGVLAKATKADIGNITSYMGTMYGIFETNAKAMGNSSWVEQVAGQTSRAVQMFKTTGPQMESAFGKLGASGAAHGIQMGEQMAILGQLQATMSGSEAATKYKAFLNGVGKAQEMLGIAMTDSQGKMLPMVDIMNNIKAKMGDIDDVAKSDALKTAFGSVEAVDLIKQLIPQTEKLASNIVELNNVTGMDGTVEMANEMVDPWMRLSGGVGAATTALGQSFMPVIEPVIVLLAEAAAGVLAFTQEFPELTGYIVAGAAGVVGLIAAISAVNIAMGIWKFMTIGAGMATMFLSVIIGTWRALVVSATAVQWLFNAALSANPIGLIVLGVVALITAIGGLFLYWNEFKAAFMDSSMGKWLSGIVDGIVSLKDKVVNFFKGLADNAVVRFFMDDETDSEKIVNTTGVVNNPVAALDVIPVTDNVSNMMAANDSNITANMPTLPGDVLPADILAFSNFNPSAVMPTLQQEQLEQIESAQAEMNTPFSSISNVKKMQSSSFIQNQIKNGGSTTANSKSMHIDQLTVTTDKPIDANSIAELMELAG